MLSTKIILAEWKTFSRQDRIAKSMHSLLYKLTALIIHGDLESSILKSRFRLDAYFGFNMPERPRTLFTGKNNACFWQNWKYSTKEFNC